MDRLLIANRGEIAVRIAATAHRLGIATVGVHSDVDADALHVDVVDRSVRLPGLSPAETYLRGDLVIDAARRLGCDAIHPGYGFLAENAEFARAVIDAGLVWVGPTPEQIQLLGDKVAAKRAAADAGVTTTPFLEVTAGAIPDDLPLPALVKAAAGGGGRGMRVVRDPVELPAAVETAAREARSAFGDGTVFIEPFIENGRHVEVQILGDAHGNVIHLGERDCSIQRRNQKLVEEAPAPDLDDDIRRRVTDGAVALARAVGYQGAGTVEFLVAPDGDVTFLEVNTRLQVEHPVTEAITGLDLVELQLRIAAGEPLPLTQSDVRFDGHAIEVRLVAEDPGAGWIPTTGPIARFDVSGPVRVDTGVRAGSTVTTDYDSLLAKVIAHAPTRDDAARTLTRSMRTAIVTGPVTNASMLAAVLAHDAFLAAEVHTGFLDSHPEVLDGQRLDPDDELAHVLAATFALDRRRRESDAVTGFAPSGWRNLRTQGQRCTWRIGDRIQAVEYVIHRRSAEVLVGAWPEPDDDGVMPADERRRVDVRLLGSDSTGDAVEVDGVRHRVQVWFDGDRADVASAVGSTSMTLDPRFVDHSAETTGSGPTSPLPGTIIAVLVEPGQTVEDGDLLVVVEAMKMEHRITATGAATVEEVLFSPGDRVDAGDLLVALRPSVGS